MYKGLLKDLIRMNEYLTDDDLKKVQKKGRITWKVLRIMDKEGKPLYIGSLADVHDKFGLNVAHFFMGDPYKILQYFKEFFPTAYSWEVPAETIWDEGETDTADTALTHVSPEEEIEKNLKELEPKKVKESNAIEQKAIKRFGLTEDPMEALYMTTDGQYLRGPEEGGEHRQPSIDILGPDAEGNALSVQSGMAQIVDTGDGGELSVRFFSKPTDRQIGKIRKLYPYREDVLVEIFDEKTNLIKGYYKRDGMVSGEPFAGLWNFRALESIMEGRPSHSKCMDCGAKPTKEVLWAEGMGHAWFCDKHYKEWSTTGDGKGEVCSVKDIKDGEAAKKFADNKNPNIKESAGDKIGDCRNENLIEDIFGSVSEFARQVEEHGDNFIYGSVKVTYDSESGIHTFYNLPKNNKYPNIKESARLQIDKKIPELVSGLKEPYSGECWTAAVRIGDYAESLGMSPEYYTVVDVKNNSDIHALVKIDGAYYDATGEINLEEFKRDYDLDNVELRQETREDLVKMQNWVYGNSRRNVKESKSGTPWSEKTDMLKSHGWKPKPGGSSKWEAPSGREYSTAWLDSQPAKEFKELLSREKI